MSRRRRPRTREADRRAITDAELLAACSFAGPSGTESHLTAARIYYRAVLEWRERDRAIRQAEAERVVFLVLHDTARDVWPAMMRERPWRGAA